MRSSHLHNYFSFYLAAFSGIFTWVAFSVILKKNALLELIGRNSLALYIWHSPAVTYSSLVLNLFFKLNLIKNLTLYIPLLYTAISITIILPANSVYNQLKLLFAGKKKNV